MKVPGFLSPTRGNLPSPRCPLPQEKEATQSFGKHVALAELPFSLVWSPRSAKRAKPPLQGEPAAPRGRPGAADAARRGPSHVRTGGRRFQGSFSRGPPHVARAASSAVPRSSIRAQRPLGAEENSTRRDTHGPRVVLPFRLGFENDPGLRVNATSAPSRVAGMVCTKRFHPPAASFPILRRCAVLPSLASLSTCRRKVRPDAGDVGRTGRIAATRLRCTGSSPSVNPS